MINSRPSYHGPEYNGLSPEERSRQVKRDQNQWDLLQAQEKANELKERELRARGYYDITPQDWKRSENSKPMSNFSEILIRLFCIAFYGILIYVIVKYILVWYFI